MLPDRGISDSKTILSCYNKLIKSKVNDECVNKVIAEKSISQASKVISALNYCKDIDKQLIYEGDICAVTYCDIIGSPYNNVLIREVKWKGSGYRLCENFAGTELSSSLTTKDIFSVKVIGNIYEGVKDGLS